MSFTIAATAYDIIDFLRLQKMILFTKALSKFSYLLMISDHQQPHGSADNLIPGKINIFFHGYIVVIVVAHKMEDNCIPILLKALLSMVCVS